MIDLRDYIRRIMWDTSGFVAMGHDFQTLGHPEGGIHDLFVNLLSEFSGSASIRMLMYYVDVRPLLALLKPLFMMTALGKSLGHIRGVIRRSLTRRSPSSKSPSPR